MKPLNSFDFANVVGGAMPPRENTPSYGEQKMFASFAHIDGDPIRYPWDYAL